MPAKASNPTTATAVDAIALLTADHESVKTLFEEYEELAESGGLDHHKEALVRKIGAELTLHAKVEERIFYPNLRAAIGEDDLLDEAEVEHASVKDLVAQLEEMLPDEHLYDAKVKVLSEYVEHHVREEEDELFPKVRSADLDLDVLGRQMAEYKESLKVEWGMLDTETPPPAPPKAPNGSKRALIPGE